MIGKEKMEWYRRATPAERFREFQALMAAVDRIMQALSPAERKRRMDWYWGEHERGNRALLEKLRALR